MDDNFFEFLVATDELDDFLGYEPKCPICEQPLIKREEDYYCEDCNKLFDKELKEKDLVN